ncbi:hypothetical protein [Dyella japonica]|uniref:hypothetical protein n=1 Tax=Dyella japonica TaxID=231455 RepID=UPI000AA810FC|nr:hypothetical protein [Dyella japonica]
MARRRKRLKWHYDNDLQQFITPAGRIVSLHDIAQLLQDQTESRHDFAGAWMGWRMRQNRLIPPGAAFRQSQITPTNLRAFARWLRSFDGEQAQLEFRSAPDRHPGASAQPESDHSDARLEARSHTSPDQCLLDAPDRSAQQGSQAPYEPRRRAEVMQLAEYRLRAISR